MSFCFRRVPDLLVGVLQPAMQRNECGIQFQRSLGGHDTFWPFTHCSEHAGKTPVDGTMPRIHGDVALQVLARWLELALVEGQQRQVFEY